jgi:hypothetical protein
MRLIELEPRWVGMHILMMRCPHCVALGPGVQQWWLTCKNAVMSTPEQFDLFEATFGEEWNTLVVPCNPDMAWTIYGRDFNSLSVTPSLDASNSGHAHFNITNGQIVP